MLPVPPLLQWKFAEEVMRMKYGRRAAMLVLACFLAAVQIIITAPPAMAASYKKVNSVSLKVRNKLRAGDSLDADDLVIAEPDEGEIGVWTNSDKFDITSLKLVSGSSKDLKVGQEVRIRAVLEINDVDSYRFKSGFSKRNVNLTGPAECTEVSRTNRKLTVTLRLNGVKGNYNEPEEAWWEDTDNILGLARWKGVNRGSGHYELQLKRGGTVVKRVADITGTSYDFYPYMTKVGSYTFRVRVIPHTAAEKSYGKNSDWTDSDEIHIDERHVSDGSGAIWDNAGSASSGSQTAPNPPSPGAAGDGAGWIQNGGSWYYRYPDGQIKQGGWEKIQNRWYSFDDNGRMRTGWYQAPNGWYYLGQDGAMLTGWQNINESWYYLDDDPNSATYGRMAANTVVSRDGRTWMVDENGHMARGWKQVGDHWSYFYPGSGEMARNTWIDTFYVDADGAWRR